MTTGTRKSPCDVEVVHPSYQPSRAKLNEDMRVDATFEEAARALARPARIRHATSDLPRKGRPVAHTVR